MTGLTTDLAAQLGAAAGPGGVLPGHGRGGDLAASGPDPAMVLRLAARERVPQVLRLLAEAGLAYGVCGGQTSYTGAVAPPSPGPWVLLDTSGLDAILAIDAANLFVHAEAGCSWQQLDAALAPLALRCAFQGPASGRHALLGATLSQNAAFLGAARHGCSAEAVLSLEIARPDGSVLTTGSAAFAGTLPFFRHAGPDLTGPFLGDCGVGGVKLATSLRLVARPGHLALREFLFACRADLFAALARITQAGLVADAIAVHGVAEEERLLLRLEAHSAAILAAEDDHLHHCCTQAGGTACPPTLAQAVFAQPFPAADMLAKGACRWVPVHGIVPPDQAPALVDTLAALAAAAQAANPAITIGIVSLAIGAGAVLVEANLWGPADPVPLAEALLAQGSGAPPAAGTAQDRAALLAVRDRIAQGMAAQGAVHFQIGRYYPYEAAIAPGNAAFLDLLHRIQRRR